MLFISHALITLRDKLEATDKERGATAVEYALIIAAVSIVLIAAVSTINIQGIVDIINDYVGSI